MFLRDASLHFADASLRGDLDSMDAEQEIEGTAVVYFQHNVENKLAELRHSKDFNITSYSHNCLSQSHTCVDTMQVNGKASAVRDMVNSLKNTKDVDRVEFITAPFRESGCC